MDRHQERNLIRAELERRKTERMVYHVFQGRECVATYNTREEADDHMDRLVEGGESAADVWGCSAAVDDPEYLTVAQAAEQLGVGANRVRALIQNGRLPARRFGSEYQIHPQDLALVADRKPGRPRAQADED